MARELKLNELPRTAELIRWVAVKNDERVAEKLVKRFAPAFYGQRLSPNHFLSMEGNLDGEFLLGFTEDGKRFGLDREQLVRHAALFGGSGFGKTNEMKSLFLQAREHQVHAIYADRKGDMDHTVHDSVDCIRYSSLRLNPLRPPHKEVPLLEYRNEFCKMAADLMQLFQRGMSVLFRGVDALFRDFHVYDTWGGPDSDSAPFPTLVDLLALFQSKEFGKTVSGYGKESLFSILDKLETLIIQLEPVVSCQRGFDIAQLYREKAAISLSLDGLGVEFQNFLLLSEILQYAHFFKTFGPRNQLNALFFFDEAKGILGKTHQDTFIVKDLVSKIREWGIGLVAADQVPSEISQVFFSNIGTLIMFRHSDGNDLQRLRYSSGATVDQVLANYSLKPGEAVVRSMKCKDLHRIKTPFQPVEKFISREEVERLMASRIDELHRDVIPMRIQSKEQPRDEAPGLSNEEQRFLELLARAFDRPSTEVYRSLGWQDSKGHRIKQRLVTKDYISEVATNLGKDGKKAVFLVPNPISFQMLGIELGHGRGKPLHRHFQAVFKTEAEKLGYAARIEDCPAGSPEGPDLGLEKSGTKIAVEISISSKPSQEAANIQKNLRLGYAFVVLTFVSRQALEKTQELAARQYQDEMLSRIRFILVTDFCRLLEAM